MAALDVNAVGPRALADDLGDAVLAVECDVSKAESVRGAVRSTVQHFGAVGWRRYRQRSLARRCSTGSANSAYCACKGGVQGLSLALAFTYGPQGIRTSVSCPGLVATPLVDHLVGKRNSWPHS